MPTMAIAIIIAAPVAAKYVSNGGVAIGVCVGTGVATAGARSTTIAVSAMRRRMKGWLRGLVKQQKHCKVFPE
jgi:hypothetical protein